VNDGEHHDREPDYGPDAFVHRAPREGYRGLVAQVSFKGRSVGVVHLSGTTPPTETTELWTADAVTDGPSRFLTEWEAIAATVAQAKRDERGLPH
jgi:hypothetical protein